MTIRELVQELKAAADRSEYGLDTSVLVVEGADDFPGRAIKLVLVDDQSDCILQIL